MNGFALLVATAVMGVDYGWQPDASGQLEYIIQIEPMTLIALREGHDIVSQIDPYVRNVRRFRLRVGTDPVPRRGLPPREAAATGSSPAPPGVQYAWQAVDQNQIEFVVQISPDRLQKMHGGQDISGELPSGLGEIVRLRIQSKTDTAPGEERPAVSGGTAGAGPESSAPANAAPPIADYSHELSQLWAIAPPETTYQPTGASATRENAATLPERTIIPRESDATPRYGQLDSRHQSLSDTPKDGAIARGAPGDEIPLTSLPLPGIGGGQTDETIRSPATDRERSVYDQRAYGWDAPNRGSSPTSDRPQRIDAGQPASPPAAFPAAPRSEYSPYASNPPASSTPPWPAESDRASTARSFTDGERSFVSDSNEIEEDRQYFGVPDSLASALGYEPWPNRVVSYDVDVTPSPPAPQDFWSSLSETANDRSLDYLREEEEGDKPWWPLTLAVLGLFASIGGNLYMGWIVAGTYRKYLDLADDLNDGDDREPSGDRHEEDSWSPRRNRRERRTAGV